MHAMIEVKQSELARIGIRLPLFALGYRDRLAATAQVLRNRGDNRTALLIELNNPVALNSIRYVNDIQTQAHFLN